MDIYHLISRKQIMVALACLAIAAIAFATALSGAASLEASASTRLLPIYNVGRDESQEKQIAISFDAAWGNEDTQTLIDIFEKYDIKVTFFVVGEWVDKFPESVKALHDAGHEVMNHSDTHPHMSKLSREQIKAEIESCNAKIEAITGERPTLFRAPYGEYCDTLIEVLAELGMYCIQWDVDSLDWKDPTPNQISDRVCSNVKNGSIVLFHNAATNTPAALPMLIENLLAQEYKFVKLTEHIYYEDYKIDHAGCQWKNKEN